MTVPLRWIGALIGAWVVAVTTVHALLNVDWASVLNDRLPVAERKFHVAFIPVT
ncbi:MAG: hypothetical protein L0271_09685 [Gemmatimonadetes bacterium]|nr:hypothetical protein [Gemmatimonadota bacterium]